MPFSDIIGQETPVSVLRRSLATGKIAHAYIFDGIEGCGKMKTAMAFITAIFCNCTEGCGHCSVCRRLAACQHPDLHMVEPDGAFIKIDQIRNLQKELSYRPYEAKKKVCIIEAADKMNLSSANAFLKTLEEPPGDALLILLTSSLGSILPTILSRCQRLSFSSIPEAAIEAYLCGTGIPEETARIAASLAGGSLKSALEITLEQTVPNRKNLLERTIALSLSEIAPLFELAEEQGNDRDKTLELLDILTVFWRDVLLLLSGSPQVANKDLLPLLRKEADRTSLEKVMERIELVFRSRQALQRNVNPRLALEVLFMGLARS
ncbi:MAG: DNA polymerase III subunit delta' [Deltaproteobacteria bacterium]